MDEAIVSKVDVIPVFVAVMPIMDLDGVEWLWVFERGMN